MAPISWIRLRLPRPQEGLQLIHDAGLRLQTSCVLGRVPATPLAAAVSAASASVVPSGRPLLCSRPTTSTRRDNNKKPYQNPNRDPRPMMQCAHVRQIRTFTRFSGCATATSSPAPIAWSVGTGAGNELFLLPRRAPSEDLLVEVPVNLN
jgi:hypothetical protein